MEVPFEQSFKVPKAGASQAEAAAQTKCRGTRSSAVFLAVPPRGP